MQSLAQWSILGTGNQDNPKTHLYKPRFEPSRIKCGTNLSLKLQSVANTSDISNHLGDLQPNLFFNFKFGFAGHYPISQCIHAHSIASMSLQSGHAGMSLTRPRHHGVALKNNLPRTT